jgi:ketosteroid isomerase-like protein
VKVLGTLCFSILLYGSSFLFAKPVEQSQAESEHYIVESERQWAESVASGDTSAVERILADDFLGVSPEGDLYDKKKMVADTRTAPQVFLSNHLNGDKVRFFGDTAVAQGSESWEKRKGEPRYGRFVWTDTWIRRNGQWQIVAAEDLTAAQATPAK